jgi:multiple sugar transport system permease protein
MNQNEPRTLISPMQLRSGRGRVIYWTVFTVVIVGFTLVFVFPLYWMVSGAFKSSHELAQSPPTLVPHSFHPGSYSQAWSQMRLARLLSNTLIYAFGAWALQIVVDVAAAYSLSKLRPVLGKAVLFMMLATLMVPTSVLVLPAYLTVANLPIFHANLLDTPAAIWLPAAANAFNIYLLKRFFDAIPTELLDAAAIDGASSLRTLWSVILPMSRPVLGVVSIFAIINVWKDFLWPLLVLPDTTKQTLNVGINSLSQNMPQNALTAALVIASIPAIVIFLIFQRNIMSGLTAGSLKG